MFFLLLVPTLNLNHDLTWIKSKIKNKNYVLVI